jgi:hypothetical protein
MDYPSDRGELAITMQVQKARPQRYHAVNTYRVWLRYELFRGRLTESEHQGSERSLAEFIAARLNRAPHSASAPN